MQKLSNQERLRPWMGFALFGVMMVIFITVCAWMQQNWGIPGLILTEFILAGLAIGFCLIRKVKISDVLPIKKITLRDFFGCIVLLISTYMISMLTVFVMAVLMPDAAEEASSLGSFLYGGDLGLIPLILIVAVLPGICEEIFHRGAILSTFRSFDKEWIAVVLVGLFFSINHLSILRGPFTFVLGAVFAYVVIKKNNILLTMLMHCLINSTSVCIAYFSASSGMIDYDNVQMQVGLDALGLYIAMFFLAPILFVTGKMLLMPETHKKRHFVIAGVISAVMLIGGSVVMMAASSPACFTASGPLEMSEGDVRPFDGILIQEEKDYTIVVVITGSNGSFRVEVKDENGEVICGGDMEPSMLQMYNSTVHMDEGEISIEIISLEGDPGETAAYNVTVK